MRITGGEARGLRLAVPRSLHVRPTSDRVRGALFQLVGQTVANANVLDLYAGTGALGIEALSRGAANVDFVENNNRLCQIIKQNIKSAGFVSRGNVHKTSVKQSLTTLKGLYDLVLLDPPYEMTDLTEIMVRSGDSNLLRNKGMVILEHSKRTVVEERYGSLCLEKQKRYGDTSVSMYIKGEA